eukprot:5247255-Amphidinium_carterae.1
MGLLELLELCIDHWGVRCQLLNLPTGLAELLCCRLHRALGGLHLSFDLTEPRIDHWGIGCQLLDLPTDVAELLRRRLHRGLG